MPENQIPATQPAAGGELNFTKPAAETPRIKRRSLKAKPAGLIKPTPAALPPAARELEREAPPLSAEQVVNKPASVKMEEMMAKPTAKSAENRSAPPRTTPTTSAAAIPSPKIASTALPSSSANASGTATSPHGTRPATLYFSSPKAETSSPMKTIPTASTASSPSPSTVTNSVPRVSNGNSASTGSRPTSTVDYRANVERQAREQKSVGSILSYVVYGLIAFFVLTAGLAAYGANIIFKQLHDQSATVSDLDAHYSKITADLNTKLASTQDTLAAAQSQISRQQELILKQQESLNQLFASTKANEASANANNDAIKGERSARAVDTANLRARVKELEYKTTIQKY